MVPVCCQTEQPDCFIVIFLNTASGLIPEGKFIQCFRITFLIPVLPICIPVRFIFRHAANKKLALQKLIPEIFRIVISVLVNRLKPVQSHGHARRQFHFFQINQQSVLIQIPCIIQFVLAVVGSKIIGGDKRNH